MHAIVSYDDTLNDQDALMLGKRLAEAGAQLSLAYVRHSVLESPDHEEFADREARALLLRGARWLDDLDAERHVIVSGSTGAGLARLAEDQEADLLVFGSDYRTPAGHVSPGRSAQRLLEGGPAALAIAPAAFRARPDRAIDSVGVLPSGDQAVLETADALADRFDAELVGATRGVDLLIVGSRAEAAPGRTLVSAQVMSAIENAVCPVIVLARATPLRFALALA